MQGPVFGSVAFTGLDPFGRPGQASVASGERDVTEVVAVFPCVPGCNSEARDQDDDYRDQYTPHAESALIMSVTDELSASTSPTPDSVGIVTTK